MNETTIAPTVGAPLYRRGELGYVTAILEPEPGVFTLGTGRMVPAGARLEVCFESHLDTLGESIVRPWLEAAQRMQAAPIGASEADAIRQRAQEAMNRARCDVAAKREAEQARAQAFRLEAEAKMPASAKAVIVADLEQDDSDSMTDYFNAKRVRTVILAWSTHTRDLFPELRTAALNYPETAHLATALESAEHREKYSMGGGYYLKAGSRYSTGWNVHKVRFYGDDRARSVPVGEWSLPAVPVPAIAAAPSASAGFRIEQHTHTRKGFQMWIAVLAERVERAEFERLSDAARALGGWYSRPWGATPGGFAFKSEAKALAFVGTGPSAEPPKPGASAPRPALGDKLRGLADGMQGEIDGRFAERRANTPKRQREAQSARLEGYRLQRTQAGLRALADLHDAGTVPAELAAVTTKAAAYALARAELGPDRGYYDAGTETGRPASDTPAALAFWALCGERSQAERAAEDLRRKVEALQFARIPGYFPTPRAIVDQMILEADIPTAPHTRVLEPSAGSGAIADAVREARPNCDLTLVERHATLREILALKGYTVDAHDFMEAPYLNGGAAFDRVLMNPPFENGQDIEHVRRAHSFLAAHGRLVAIMSSGPFYRSDSRSAAFREWFAERGGTKVELPDGAFKESGTGVGTVLVIIEGGAQ